jgi:hypothetical protein
VTAHESFLRSFAGARTTRYPLATLVRLSTRPTVTVRCRSVAEDVVLVGVIVGVGPVADVRERVGVLDVVAGLQPAPRTASAVAETAKKVDR